MKGIHIILNGLSPILEHNPLSMVIGGEEKFGKKKIPTPQEEAKAARYVATKMEVCRLNETPPSQTNVAAQLASLSEEEYEALEKVLVVPAIAVRASMLNGAKGYRIGKTAARTILAGAVSLALNRSPMFPLIRNGEYIDENDYEIDIRRVVIQKAGIMRARPLIRLPWELECVFEFNEELATEDHVRMALNSGGQVAGLLDGRPQSKTGTGLWFGRYEVKEITVV